jgi:hypothetical protein
MIGPDFICVFEHKNDLITGYGACMQVDLCQGIDPHEWHSRLHSIRLWFFSCSDFNPRLPNHALGFFDLLVSSSASPEMSAATVVPASNDEREKQPCQMSPDSILIWNKILFLWPLKKVPAQRLPFYFVSSSPIVSKFSTYQHFCNPKPKHPAKNPKMVSWLNPIAELAKCVYTSCLFRNLVVPEQAKKNSSYLQEFVHPFICQRKNELWLWYTPINSHTRSWFNKATSSDFTDLLTIIRTLMPKTNPFLGITYPKLSTSLSGLISLPILAAAVEAQRG